MTETFGAPEATRVLLEASTESEWVARCIERVGHEVIIADPGFAPMYAMRGRKVKTDRRDARCLTDARHGAFQASHRTSDASPQRAPSSGEKRQLGHITKRGQSELRALPVEASRRILRSKERSVTGLKTWTESIASRRGKAIAIVAFARKIAGVLFVIWRDGTELVGGRTNTQPPRHLTV